MEIQAQPLQLTLGASYCDGIILVPSASVDPVLQPQGAFEAKETSFDPPGTIGQSLVANPGTTPITILAVNSDHGLSFAEEETRTMV